MEIKTIVSEVHRSQTNFRPFKHFQCYSGITRTAMLQFSLTMQKTQTNRSAFSELEDSSHDTIHCFVRSDVNLRLVPSSSAST